MEQDAEYYRTHQHTNSNARKNIFQAKSSFPLQRNYLPRILRRPWQDSAKVPSRGVWLFRLARILSGVGWLCWRMLMETHARSILHVSFTHHVRASVWLQTRLFHLSRISVLVWSKRREATRSAQMYKSGLVSACMRRKRSVGPWNDYLYYNILILILIILLLLPFPPSFFFSKLQ